MKVLVAVEDAVFGDALADFIKKYQWTQPTEFKVIHVLPSPEFEALSDVTFLPFLEDTSQEARKIARALVRHVALKIRDALKSTHVEEELVEGRAKEKILEIAETWPADLILVGSHGRSGVDRLLVGSISSAVVSHAHCAVIMVKPLSGSKKSAAEQDVETKTAQMANRS